MSLSRLDLDGFGSPSAIAERIHELAIGLRPRFDIAHLCKLLDIESITEVETSSYEAALLMDEHKAHGSILLAKDSHPDRHRFSIGHELGHFLIPTHMPSPGQPISCALSDFHHTDIKAKDRHTRIEAEANRFAAALLMPPKKLRQMMTAREPNLAEIVSLASEFGVSKEAMARSYVDAHRADIAIVILKDRRLHRVYRPNSFPWIEPRIGEWVPPESVAATSSFAPRELSEIEECDPDAWLGERAARSVETLTEQVLGQSNSYSMILLRAEQSEQ